MILDCFEWKIQTNYCMSNVQIFLNVLEVMKQVGSFFLTCLSPFLWTSTTFAFSHLLFSMQDLKTISEDLEMDSPQILVIRILMKSKSLSKQYWWSNLFWSF